MRRTKLILTALLVPIDALMILVAFVLAYWVRTQIEYTYIMPFAEYLKPLIWMTPLWLITLAIQGLYSYPLAKRGWQEFGSIFIAAAAGITYIVFWLFLTRQFFFSRLVILYAWGLSLTLLIAGRLIIHAVEKWLYFYGIGLGNVIIVGNPKLAESLIVGIQKNKGLGLKILGLVTGQKPKTAFTPFLGKPINLEKIIEKIKPDELFLMDPEVSGRELNKVITLCRNHKIIFKTMPGPLFFPTRNIVISTLVGIPLVELKETPLEGWGKILKRITDLVLSVIFIIVSLPIALIVALLVKLTSRGPILYAHTRVGSYGRFIVYKFRTMKFEYCVGREYGGREAEKLENKLIALLNKRKGPVPKIKKDPRLTPIGGLLRHTSLDELPQLLNVLRGNMSLVGPRPHLPKEVAKYQQKHKKLLLIKPGLTGLAQISGRSDLDFNDEARLDIYYIENWSLWLDLQIILKTFWVLIKKTGAY